MAMSSAETLESLDERASRQSPAARQTEPDLSEILGHEDSGRTPIWVKRGLGVAVVAVTAAGLYIWSGSGSPVVQRFQTAPVQHGDLTVFVAATGNLEPTNQVEIGTELSGTVRTVAVDFNDSVRVGQVLATLDTDRLDAQVAHDEAALALASAQVREAQATVTEAKRQLTRIRELAGQSLISEQELDSARAVLERAEAAESKAAAQVLEAEATLDADRANLAKAVIRSPIDGIVLNRSIEPGVTVAASLQAPVLFTLAESLEQMELHVDVDEADIGRVTVGQEATFTVDAYPDRRFSARITEVHFASSTVDGVVTYEAILDVENPETLLRPGMTATADVVVARVDDTLLVPNAALRFTPPTSRESRSDQRGGLLTSLLPRPGRGTGSSTTRAAPSVETGQSVWVLRDGRPTAIALETGPTDGTMTAVTAGDIAPEALVLVDVLAEGEAS